MKRYALPIAAGAAGAAVMAIAVLWAAAEDEPLALFTRDLRVLASEQGTHLRYYAGSVSMFTNLLWIAGATLAGTAAVLARSSRVWFAGFALLLCLLGLDDAFMLHESVGPYHGVPELAFYAVYAVAGLALTLPLLAADRRPLLLVYIAGMAMLGAGMMSDVVLDDPYLVEDGLKLMGVAVLVTMPIGPLAEARRQLDWNRRDLDVSSAAAGGPDGPGFSDAAGGNR